MTLKRLALPFCLLLIQFTAHSQQAAIQNPQAVALATQAMAALTGTTQVSDMHCGFRYREWEYHAAGFRNSRWKIRYKFD
jgi:membrane protein YdbS with pleckstrin-like domain